VKTKTTLLAIFLTFANLTLHADAELMAKAQTEQVSEDTVTDTEDQTAVPKYVTPADETMAPKKDRTRLYNFLLALAAVAIATTAIILTSSNKGKHANNY
jgi:hypothetical protein